MNSKKSLIAAVCFLTAIINVAAHVSDYKHDRRPSGLRLVFATLGVIAGALALISDALEKKRAESSRLCTELDNNSDCEAIPDDISFEDETPDDVMICFDDCIECRG